MAYNQQEQYYQQPPYNPQYQTEGNGNAYYLPPDQNTAPHTKQNYKDTQPLNKENERFNANNPCRDMIWAIAFLIQLVGIIVLSIYYYNKNSDFLDDDDNENTIVGKNFWGLAAICVLSGIGSAALWIFWMRTCSHYLIWFSLILSLSMMIIMGLFFFAAGSILGGVICFILAALEALWIYCVRDRIAFAAAVLKLAIQACNEFSSIYLVSFLSTFVQALWMIIWTMGVCFVVYDGENNNNCDDNNDNNSSNDNTDCQNNVSSGVIFLFALSFYWTTQVIANVVFVTSSGVVATWYFLFPNHTPNSPVFGSFKRAMWNSFGSICFGSFVIALIQAIRFMVQASRNSKNGFLRACAECILGCIENLINYFNTYAFARVAIYGTTYCQSARETWELFKARGLTMVINDDLIGGVLGLACFFAGAFAAVITMAFANYILTSDEWEAWSGLAFVVGFGLTLCAIVVIRAGVVTIFVCFAEDPAALAVKQQEYEEITTAWRKRYGELPAKLTNPQRY